MKNALVAVVIASAFVLGVSTGGAQSSALTPEEQARLQQCVASGDDHCIVGLVGDRPLTPREGRALFNAQRNLGDRAGACRTGRLLVAMEDLPAAQRSMLHQYLDRMCR